MNSFDSGLVNVVPSSINNIEKFYFYVFVNHFSINYRCFFLYNLFRLDIIQLNLTAESINRDYHFFLNIWC